MCIKCNFFFFLETVLLYFPDWPRTQNLPSQPPEFLDCSNVLPCWDAVLTCGIIIISQQNYWNVATANGRLSAVDSGICAPLCLSISFSSASVFLCKPCEDVHCCSRDFFSVLLSLELQRPFQRLALTEYLLSGAGTINLSLVCTLYVKVQWRRGFFSR